MDVPFLLLLDAFISLAFIVPIILFPILTRTLTPIWEDDVFQHVQ